MPDRAPCLATAILIPSILASAILGTTLLAEPARAATIAADVVASIPSYDGSDWSTFTAARGTVNKPIRVRFVSDGATGIPLATIGDAGNDCTVASNTCVRLRAGTSPGFNTPKVCTRWTMATEPELSAANTGQCFYELSSTGSYTDVIIYHMALLVPNEDIRIEIANLQPGFPTDSFSDFDSDTVDAMNRPQPDPTRPAANLVLVVDKSGSMSWSNNPDMPGCDVLSPPPPGCEPSRWTVLTGALAQMAAVAKAHILPGDEVGAVAFDSDAQVRQNLIGANTPTLDSIVADIQGNLTPGGGTSIGDGVDELAEPLAADAAENNLMLLFTDGQQNQAFYLRLVGNALRINEDSNADTGSNVRDLPADFDLCIFALNAEGATNPLNLQGISDLRCGMLNVETGDIDPADDTLITFFLEVLNRALIGDKLEMAAAQSQRLAISAGQRELTESVVIGRNSLGFTALLSWARDGNDIEVMTLEKDGVRFGVVGTGVAVNRLDRGRDFVAATLRAGACGTDANGERACLDDLGGTWTLTAQPDFEASEVFDASLAVVSDNATFASAFEVAATAPALGTPLRLRAELSDARAPVADLPPGSVRAIVQRPRGNRGDALARAEVKPDVRQGESDPVSMAALKALTARGTPVAGDLFRRALTLDRVTVDLTETDPGVYTAEVPAAFAGAYQVRFELDAPDTKRNGPIRRVFETSFLKPVPLDAVATRASITLRPSDACKDDQRCFTALVTPQDANGVRLGPNLSPTIVAQGDGVHQVGAVRDRLDGSYEVTLACPPRGTCAPTVSVRGRPVSFEAPGEPAPAASFTYDVKVICGLVPAGKRTPLGPGRYATIVNVMATQAPTEVRLRLAPALPEGEARRLDTRKVKPGRPFALECAELGERLFTVQENAGRRSRFAEGYLILSAKAPLDVTAVYTAGPAQDEGSSSPSLEIRNIAPRRAP